LGANSFKNKNRWGLIGFWETKVPKEMVRPFPNLKRAREPFGNP